MKLALEDVKILDLSQALAGPFCSTLLGDFGAQVVKIEVPAVGDIARAGDELGADVGASSRANAGRMRGMARRHGRASPPSSAARTNRGPPRG